MNNRASPLRVASSSYYTAICIHNAAQRAQYLLQVATAKECEREMNSFRFHFPFKKKKEKEISFASLNDSHSKSDVYLVNVHGAGDAQVQGTEMDAVGASLSE